MKKVKCPKCGYEWVPRVENPKECPMCKRMLKEIVKVAVIVLIFLLTIPAFAFDYSMGVAVGYNKGYLGQGYNNPSLGTAANEAIPVSIIGRISKGLFVAEIDYKQARYNEDTYTANIHLEPKEFSIRAGLKKEFYGIEFLGLVGWTHWWGDLYVVQTMADGSSFVHANSQYSPVGGNLFDVVSFRFGAAKYIGHFGIEAGIEYYPMSMGISRCMTWSKNPVEPYLALQVKF
jgi:hypothetical protein